MTTALTTRDEVDITSGIMKFFMVIIVAVIMADIVTRLIGTSMTSEYIQSQMYRGVTDPRVVEASDELTYLDLVGEHPYTPWVSASLLNDGPDSIWVSVNQPSAAYELESGESSSVFRIGAQERISTLFFLCNTGEEASMRVVGEY